MKYLPSYGIIISIAIMPAIAFAQDGQPDWVADAKALAQSDGISVGEAIKRIRLVEKAGALQERLEREDPDGFAGLTIDSSNKQFRVKVRRAKGLKPFASPADTDLAGSVDNLESARSLKELRQTQQQVMVAMKQAGVENYSSIDIQANGVTLFVKDEAAARAAISSGKVAAIDFLKIVQVESFPVPIVEMTGGLAAQSSLGGCTTGFPVQNYSGVKGISLAGHCPGIDWTYNGSALPLQQRNYAGNFDIQWHTAPGFTVSNNVSMGSGGTRAVTTASGISVQVVGAPVCKYGRSTNYTCGKIVDNNVRFTGTGSTTTGPWVLVKSPTVPIMCAGGDSGGPVMNGASAYGISTNCSSESGGPDLYYMPVDRFSGVSVLVRTSP